VGTRVKSCIEQGYMRSVEVWWSSLTFSDDLLDISGIPLSAVGMEAQ